MSPPRITFPLISPSAYYAAAAEGVRVIQTLHNYCLLCVNELLFGDALGQTEAGE